MHPTRAATKTRFLNDLEASLASYTDAELKAIERFLRESSALAMRHAGAGSD